MGLELTTGRKTGFALIADSLFKEVYLGFKYLLVSIVLNVF